MLSEFRDLDDEDGGGGGGHRPRHRSRTPQPLLPPPPPPPVPVPAPQPMAAMPASNSLVQQRKARVTSVDPKQRKAMWLNVPLKDETGHTLVGSDDDEDSSSSSSSSSEDEGPKKKREKKEPVVLNASGKRVPFPWAVKNETRCWLCAEMCHVRDTNTTSQDLNNVMALVLENIGMLKWAEICLAVSQYVWDHITSTAKDPEAVIPLSPDKVNEHFRQHNLDPRLSNLFALIDLKEAEEEVKASLKKVNALTDESVVDPVQLRNLALIQKIKKELYSWDTTNMNFLCKDAELNNIGRQLLNVKKAVRKF